MRNSQASTISAASSGGTAVTAETRASGVSSMDLPDLPWSDWQIKADDIIITKDENGNNVVVGTKRIKPTVEYTQTMLLMNDTKYF